MKFGVSAPFTACHVQCSSTTWPCVRVTAQRRLVVNLAARLPSLQTFPLIPSIYRHAPFEVTVYKADARTSGQGQTAVGPAMAKAECL